MGNKYYTPSIEEFHIGVEYEIEEPDGSWTEQKLTVRDNLEFIDDHISEFRIKYLDRDDIESLGINVGEWLEVDILGTWKIDFLYREHGYSTLGISTKDFIRDGSGNYHISTIRPKIKNKSELKILLKQIGIL